MQELPHTRSCFVCGESNPSGLKLIFHTDGKIVEARFTPAPDHIGFRETVHGGILATVLDEIMVWACAVQTKQWAYCAEFTVRFIQPAKPGEMIRATAELAENRRNKIFEAKGELRTADGVLLASASGKYLPLKPNLAQDMLGDLIGDTSAITGAATATRTCVSEDLPDRKIL